MALKANGTLEKMSKFDAQVDTGGCRNRTRSGMQKRLKAKSILQIAKNR